jgi:hypothetical protein
MLIDIKKTRGAMMRPRTLSRRIGVVVLFKIQQDFLLSSLIFLIVNFNFAVNFSSCR